MYIEAGGIKSKGDKARLIGGIIPDDAPHCVQFWYHLHGIHIGELRFYVQVKCVISIPNCPM